MTYSLKGNGVDKEISPTAYIPARDYHQNILIVKSKLYKKLKPIMQDEADGPKLFRSRIFLMTYICGKVEARALFPQNPSSPLTVSHLWFRTRTRLMQVKLKNSFA